MLVWILALMLTFVCIGLLILTRRVTALRREVAGLSIDLSRECASLRALQSEQRQDMYGLSAAGVQQDRRLIEQDMRLREMLERVDSLRADDAGGQPYHAAIERARKGARAEELVTEFGLSLSEAGLLVRLHGGRDSGRS
jgi:hypothetical protein